MEKMRQNGSYQVIAYVLVVMFGSCLPRKDHAVSIAFSAKAVVENLCSERGTIDQLVENQQKTWEKLHMQLELLHIITREASFNLPTEHPIPHPTRKNPLRALQRLHKKLRRRRSTHPTANLTAEEDMVNSLSLAKDKLPEDFCTWFQARCQQVNASLREFRRRINENTQSIHRRQEWDHSDLGRLEASLRQSGQSLRNQPLDPEVEDFVEELINLPEVQNALNKPYGSLLFHSFFTIAGIPLAAINFTAAQTLVGVWITVIALSNARGVVSDLHEITNPTIFPTSEDTRGRLNILLENFQSWLHNLQKTGEPLCIETRLLKALQAWVQSIDSAATLTEEEAVVRLNQLMQAWHAEGFETVAQIRTATLIVVNRASQHVWDMGAFTRSLHALVEWRCQSQSAL